MGRREPGRERPPAGRGLRAMSARRHVTATPRRSRAATTPAGAAGCGSASAASAAGEAQVGARAASRLRLGLEVGAGWLGRARLTTAPAPTRIGRSPAAALEGGPLRTAEPDRPTGASPASRARRGGRPARHRPEGRRRRRGAGHRRRRKVRGRRAGRSDPAHRPLRDAPASPRPAAPPGRRRARRRGPSSSGAAEPLGQARDLIGRAVEALAAEHDPRSAGRQRPDRHPPAREPEGDRQRRSPATPRPPKRSAMPGSLRESEGDPRIEAVEAHLEVAESGRLPGVQPRARRRARSHPGR